MRVTSVALLAASGAVALAAMAFTPPAEPAYQGAKGSKAAAFKAMGTDGKTHTLAELAKDGPVHLYFIKIGCPVNHEAAPFVAKMDKTYGKSRIVGVINGSVDDAKKWAAEYKAKFLILSDRKQDIIRAYGAAHSPWLISVAKGGKVQLNEDGCAPMQLASLNKLVAKGAGKPAAKIDFKGAPEGGG